MLPASGGNLSGGCNPAGSSSYDVISSGILLEHDFLKIHFIGWSPRGGPSNTFTSLHLSTPGRYKEELPPRYRNLEAGQLEDSAHWGAGVWLADFCPTVVTMEAEC